MFSNQKGTDTPMPKSSSTSYVPMINAFAALMMAIAAFNLLTMPDDLKSGLAEYGLTPDHQAVYAMTWATVIATPILVWEAYQSWRRR
jgi:hypothetical protein